MSIHKLYETIQDRKQNPSSNSYTAQLFSTGQDEIIKKVGEEAVEVILAAKGQGKDRLIEEIADLTYHVLVLMAYNQVTPEDITAELEKRRK
jgi:phosphoribosyl-ATP pyrophosphohydrolase